MIKMTPIREKSEINWSEKQVPRVAVIILNWKGWKDTIECLESVYQINYPKYDVLVVDNASNDDSIGKITGYALGKVRVHSKFFKYTSVNKPITIFNYTEGEYPTSSVQEYESNTLPPNNKMILIKNKKNYGFAEGNNIAIRFALKKLNTDYILLLNNDTVVNKNFLLELIKAAENGPNIGVVGPKIYYYDFQGRTNIINFAGEDLIPWKLKGIRYGYKQVDKAQYDTIRSVDKIDGACMLIKRDVLSRVGLLDSNLFLYWEETDFCVRAKKRGYRLLYVPTSMVWHKVPPSMGFYKPSTSYHFNKSRLIFVNKNLKEIDQLKFLLYFLFYRLWVELGYFLLHVNINALILTVRGIIDGFKILVSSRIHESNNTWSRTIN
jgi:GT2 family glycosyltransferase